MVLLGGVQTIAGPIVGALAYTGLYDALLLATSAVAAGARRGDRAAGARVSPGHRRRRAAGMAAAPRERSRGRGPAQAFRRRRARCATCRFAVAAGEMVALIGPNGAGKIHLLQHAQRPVAPRCRARAHRRARRHRPARRAGSGAWASGRTFQITATFASMTVRENVQMALLSHHDGVWRFWRAARHRRVAEADALLASVGLADAGRARRRRAGLRRSQAAGTGDRARERTASAADGRAHGRHGAGRACGADAACARRSRPGAASRCCSPSTTWTWCSPSPTGFSCCTRAR